MTMTVMNETLVEWHDASTVNRDRCLDLEYES